MQMHIHSFAWLLMLLSPYALSTETFAPEPASGPPTLTAQYPVNGEPVASWQRVHWPARQTEARLL